MNAVNKTVFHKAYGKGIVKEHNGGKITVDFSGTEKLFFIPDSFEKGFLSTEDEELNAFVASTVSDKINTEAMKNKERKTCPVLFCNISWMENYLGENENDIPVNGGSHVKKHKTCNESVNFSPIIVTTGNSDEEKLMLLGSFETKSTNGEVSNQTHIERINGCKALTRSNQADGVTVVWCATAPSGSTRVVGWYKNATVYRYYKQMPMEEEDGFEWERWYNVSCDACNAVLLPTKERFNEKWSVPRHNPLNPVPFGFGQANIWYADQEEAKDYVCRMIESIESYCGENIIPSVEGF